MWRLQGAAAGLLLLLGLALAPPAAAAANSALWGAKGELSASKLFDFSYAGAIQGCKGVELQVKAFMVTAVTCAAVAALPDAAACTLPPAARLPPRQRRPAVSQRHALRDGSRVHSRRPQPY